jgi:adenylate cyclase
VRIAHAPSALPLRRPRGGAVRAVRLATGLVLVTYVAGHLINHALGVLSIDLQEALLAILAPLWQSLPGTVLLYSALVTHALLGLYALWRRQTLRMPAWELIQLTLGLTVPLLLIPHVFGTRVASALLGTEPTYHVVISALWSSPTAMIRQPVLVVVVWTHLAIGLHYWLRLSSAYRRSLRLAYPIAVIVPLVALLGFWGAGFELAAAPASAPADSPAPDPAAKALLEARQQLAYDVYAALLLLALSARILRRSLQTRRGTYRIHHSNGRIITAPIGHSVLEALREAGVPHASVCGGRARCTTCRVRIGHGSKSLPPPGGTEISALQRIGAEKNVRLACQLRPSHAVHITPLLPPHVGPAELDAGRSPGRERAVAVMFVDLRESSRLGEQRMPYDVLFILNRFFAEMAEALRETGGYYSTFNGDGLMALYGAQSDLRSGCCDAMRGAMAIATRLAAMNAALQSDLGEPLRVGISIHAGEAIIGTMGPPATPILSALGDTVNVAARLESETKRHGCVVVISSACARAAAVDLTRFPEHTATVRGRSEPVTYFAIADPAAIAACLPQPENARAA